MVDEVIVTTLSTKIKELVRNSNSCKEYLRSLFDYESCIEQFSGEEKEVIVRAISQLKILDPAVGSGAFPMAVLHKLTYALRQLDPDNLLWKKIQIDAATQRSSRAYMTKEHHLRDEELVEISAIFENYSGDFGRKLYLIHNSIFGVDIQSIACQITKLRFFISLAIEQVADSELENFGIKPLPNLETRFVAANSLLPLVRQRTVNSILVDDLVTKLIENRENHFHANSPEKKIECVYTDVQLRKEIAQELKISGSPPDAVDQLVSWNPYDQNNVANWFDPEYMFGLTKFDIVIGNPPYVQLSKIVGNLAKNIRMSVTVHLLLVEIYIICSLSGDAKFLTKMELLHSLPLIDGLKWIRLNFYEIFFQHHQKLPQLVY